MKDIDSTCCARQASGRSAAGLRIFLQQVQNLRGVVNRFWYILEFRPLFCLFKNLKAQILEICPSAQESAQKNRAASFLKIFTAGQRYKNGCNLKVDGCSLKAGVGSIASKYKSRRLKKLPPVQIKCIEILRQTRKSGRRGHRLLAECVRSKFAAVPGGRSERAVILDFHGSVEDHLHFLDGHLCRGWRCHL